MPKQQDTFDRPFCQTAIPRGRSRAFFVRILSVDRPLYLSLERFSFRRVEFAGPGILHW